MSLFRKKKRTDPLPAPSSQPPQAPVTKPTSSDVERARLLGWLHRAHRLLECDLRELEYVEQKIKGQLDEEDSHQKCLQEAFDGISTSRVAGSSWLPLMHLLAKARADLLRAEETLVHVRAARTSLEAVEAELKRAALKVLPLISWENVPVLDESGYAAEPFFLEEERVPFHPSEAAAAEMRGWFTAGYHVVMGQDKARKWVIYMGLPPRQAAFFDRQGERAFAVAGTFSCRLAEWLVDAPGSFSTVGVARSLEETGWGAKP